MAWLVTYVAERIGEEADHSRTAPENVILERSHPVTWATRPNTHWKVILLFFAEIDVDQVEAAARGGWIVQD